MIKFTCPHCQLSINVPPSAAGRKAACPKCKKPLTVPAYVPPENEAPSAPDFSMVGQLLGGDDEPEQARQQKVNVQIAPNRGPSKAAAAASVAAMPFQAMLSMIWGQIRRFAVEITLVLVLAATAGGIYWYVLRDNWEDENLPRLTALRNEAVTLENEGAFKESIDKYVQVLDEAKTRKDPSPKLKALIDDVQGAIDASRGARDRQVFRRFTVDYNEALRHRATEPEKTVAAYNEILKTAQSLNTTDTKLKELIDIIQTDRDGLVMPLLRAELAKADLEDDDRPGVKMEAYAEILKLIQTMPLPSDDAVVLRDRVIKRHADYQRQTQRVVEYFESMDPFINVTIPFMRRLRWGVTEGSFAIRVLQMVSTWEKIADPPDRTTAGLLLTHSNNIARHLRDLEEVRRRRPVLNREWYQKSLLAAKPDEVVNALDWGNVVQKYLGTVEQNIKEPSSTGAWLPHIGETVRMAPQEFNSLFDDFRRFELAFRMRYEETLGRPYRGKMTTLDDEFDVKMRAAFYNSLDPILDGVVPAMRRLERGAGRSSLLERIATYNQLLGETIDPPDDSDQGAVYLHINHLARTLHQYCFVAKGLGAIDIVGQDDPASKAVNDAADALLAELKKRRDNPATDKETLVYKNTKMEWYEAEREKMREVIEREREAKKREQEEKQKEKERLENQK